MPRKVRYNEYLKSPYWRAIRRRVLYRAGNQCEHCGSSQNLQIHHKTYERLGCEQMDDLEALCDSCHAHHHQLPARPVIRSSGPEHISVILQRMGIL
jgi:5-methylcytosine-specific restriction endonuclease McrA